MTVLERDEPLLSVEALRVSFRGPSGPLVAVDGVDLSVGRGERVAIVGESGSGKSVSALAIMRLIEYQGGIVDPASRVVFEGVDLTKVGQKQMQQIRGKRIGLVLQDHQGALNPVRRVGDQIADSLLLHRVADGKRAARQQTIELLDRVGIARPASTVDAYPHELSGGMRQRVLIAAAIGPRPDLIVADEPTTALDAVIQRQIVDLLHELSGETGSSVLLISHDLRMVSSFADRVCVIYAGRIVEEGSVADVFAAPRHHYTAALLESLTPGDDKRLRVIQGSAPPIGMRPSGCAFHPRCPERDGSACVAELPDPVPGAAPGHRVACHHPLSGGARRDRLAAKSGRAAITTVAATLDGHPLLEVSGLVKQFGRRRRGEQPVAAVDDISFTIHRGETFGVVGESGSGKSTVARCIARLIDPTSGSVTFDGQDLMALNRREMRRARQRIQMVFQDARASLDPRLRVRDLLEEPLRIFGRKEPGRAVELLERVGLGERDLVKFPHEFSGGQLQRVALARALMLSPDLLVCDEPVSSLDASVSAQIINLLQELQADFGLTYLFISHDLAVVRHFCDRTAVMQAGKVVELAETHALFEMPQHAYTRTLLEAQMPGLPSATPASPVANHK